MAAKISHNSALCTQTEYAMQSESTIREGAVEMVEGNSTMLDEKFECDPTAGGSS
jgi:hypothetical protein